MAKNTGTFRNLQKGDKITATTAASRDPNTHERVGQGKQLGELTVTRAYSHGVSTKEAGYINGKFITSITKKEE